MLYLSRKIGESIIINDKIVFTVAEIKGKTVKLSFDSPPGVKILRKELYDKIYAQNRQAAESAVLLKEVLK